jgi:hypothetical protein
VSEHACEMWPHWPTSERPCDKPATWVVPGEARAIYACDECVGENRPWAKPLAPRAVEPKEAP